MTIKFRHYEQDDYNGIDEFLIKHYQPNNADTNWIEPIWEYMHGHPALDISALDRIGVWEDNGKIIAVAHYESTLGEAFFQFHPAHKNLKGEMLAYAEQNLFGISKKDGRKFLMVYVNDYDEEFIALVKARGYARDAEESRPLYKFDIPKPFPAIQLPDGFLLTSLADEPDWAKVHRVLWRGFDHGDDVPMNEEEFESRRKMFDTPKARRDLKIAVKAPDGDFVAFCGMFYEPTNQYAYVEPVATDPNFRRMGLGKAAVLEGVRRCGELGATVAYVGSDQQFYQSIGFKKVYVSESWLKYFD